MNKIRARVIIIDQNRILLIKRVKKDSIYWIFPGGGVEDGETSEEAVVRECKEELGVDVFMKKYFDAVETEYFGQMHENRFYICKITGGEVGTGNGPEYQEGDYYEGEHIPEWLSKKEFEDNIIKPDGVKDKILKLF